jgi:hypothetical protein
MRVACFKGYTETAAMLIENGADDDGALFAAEEHKDVLPTWKAARALVTRDAQMARSLQPSESGGGAQDPDGDLLGDHLPAALASIVAEYVFFRPSLDLQALTAGNGDDDDDA